MRIADIKRFRRSVARFGTILLLIWPATEALAQADAELRFTRPAARFTESCPVGNGRLGAMVFGNPDRERIVRLLPALPSAAIFQNGAIGGIRARNGFAIDMTWKDGKIKRLVIHSYDGKICRIALPDHRILSFRTIAGRNYTII
jgi:hypothetical protein